MTKQLHRIILLLFVLLVAVACRQDATVSADNVNLDITVTDSLVGETTLIVAVTDTDGNAIEDAGTLNLRGDMDHAGMVPVIVDAEESDNGVFTVPFEWTMGGAWTVEATLTLPNEETVTTTFNYEILTEASEADMDMNMTDDAEETPEASMGMNMRGETSAVYMQITNNGDETMTIIGADASVAGITEIHETIVENDVARMQPIDTIVIAPDETVELRPGGMHIMLMQLTEDVITDETIDVELQLESGDTIAISALVQDMPMDDLDDETVVSELAFANVWARPASAGMMDMDAEGDPETDMNMDITDDMSAGASSRWQMMLATVDLIGTNPMDMSSDLQSDEATDADMSDDDEETSEAGVNVDEEDDMSMDTPSLWEQMIATKKQ